MIKLFATDLDGTLLNKEHKVDETIEKAIQTIVENQLFFTVATGRPKALVDLGNVKDIAYYVTANGSLIYNPKGELLYKSLIDKESLKGFLKYASDFVVEYCAPDTIYVQDSKETYFDKKIYLNAYYGKATQWIKDSIEKVAPFYVFDASDEEILQADICKLNCRIFPQKDYSAFDAFLEEHTEDLVNASCSEAMYELTKAGVSKGEAVHWLASYLGLEDDEVAVYGDDENDIVMLDRFKHSYAPSSGNLKAIQVANYTIGPYQEYSVIRHILDTIKEQ